MVNVVIAAYGDVDVSCSVKQEIQENNAASNKM